MLNKIIDGISEKLNATFGDEYEVHTEQVKQGLDPPCFLISLVNPTSTPVVGNRYSRQNLFSVKYFPLSKTGARAEYLNVQDELFLALEYITADGDMLRGTGMNGQIVDGILVFIVNYGMFVRKESDKDLMETLKVINAAGGGQA